MQSSQNKYETRTKIRAQRYRQSGLTEHFTEAVFKDEYGKLFDSVEIHKEWHRFIREQLAKGKRRIGIMGPWKFGKTPHILAIALCKLDQNPNLRIKIVCNDDNEAMKRVATLKGYIDNDKEFHAISRVRADRRTMWTKHAITVERESKSVDPTVEANGVMTTGIGGTCDLLIFDDICDLNNSVLSPAKREAVKEMVNNVWLSRLEPEGVALLIGTAWHSEDASHELVKNPEWVFLLQRISEDFEHIEQTVVNG
jgi:hypothetical protein